MELKVCVNCEHFCEDEHPACDSDEAIVADLVRGGTYYKTCLEMRENNLLCGRMATLFEPIEKLEEFGE
jgi:hypothetical protein